MTEGKNTPALKLCPFCGGAASFFEGKDDFEHSIRGVGCHGCEAQMDYSPDADPWEVGGSQEEQDASIIKAWNTRADDPATLRDRNAELEAALRKIADEDKTGPEYYVEAPLPGRPNRMVCEGNMPGPFAEIARAALSKTERNAPGEGK